ncbi:MAG: C/D box methylation guide ribonucleoprotein complex aNOP56 subunit [Candidatus Hodarchaeota archaeon]
MKVHLVLTSLGYFILDDESKVVSSHLLYPDTDTASREIAAIRDGQSTAGLQETMDLLKELGAVQVVVDDEMMARNLVQDSSIDISIDENSPIIKMFRDTQDEYLIKRGAVKSLDKIAEYRRDVSIRIARSSIIEASEEKDLLIKHAIDAVGEVDRSINILAMRLREWYSLHHPSLSNLIEEHDLYTKILTKSSGRSTITSDLLKEFSLSEDMASSILDSLERDLGAPFRDNDLEVIRSLSQRIQELYSIRKELEEYIDGMMTEVAPNIKALVGHMVGARLISLAGSLKDLATKPSSTVQIFGAERALFRSLKTGSDPPKHGIIYQVPEVHLAPYWQRGKIARALAGKVSIAARIDAYSDRDVGDDLRKKFIDRVEEIRKQNAEAPPPKPPKKPSKPQRKKHDRRDRGRPKRGKGDSRK